MSWVATAVVGGSIISGALANKGAKDAAKASQAGTEASIAEQRRQYDTTREDLKPYREVGVGALDKLAKLYGLATPGTPDRWDAEKYILDNPDVAAADWARNDPYKHYLMYGSRDGRTTTGIIKGTPGTPAGPSDGSVFFESPDYQFNLAEGQKAIDRSLIARGRGLSGAGVKEGIRYASGMASNEFGNFYQRLANLAGIGQAATNSTAAAGTTMANNNSSALINNGNNRASIYAGRAENVNNAVQGGIGNLLMARYLGGGNGYIMGGG